MMDDEPVRLPFAKAEGILYCLAAEGVVKKDRLCDIFWGDSPAELAKKSLRNAIYALRRSIGSYIVAPAANDSLSIGSDFHIESDLTWLADSSAVPAKSIHALLSFYQQDFLSKLTIRASEVFSEWQLIEQQKYRESYLSKLEKSAESAWREGFPEEARACYEKMIHLDNFQELPYQKLIELLLQLNRRQEAVKVYTKLETLLREELFIRPSKALTDLVEDALLKPGNANAKDPFFGRSQERRQLRQYYQNFLAGGTQANFCITGEPGVGKSALLTAWRNELGSDSIQLTAASYSSEKDFPYKLWHSFCGQFSAMVKAQELVLGDELLQSMQQMQPDISDAKSAPEPGDPAVSRMDYFILRLLRYVCLKKPVVLVIDDLQWVDARSIQLLSRVLAENERVMLAATSRDDQMANLHLLRYSMNCGRPLQLLPLDRFGPDETRELLHSIAPELQDLHELIYRESEGNAFFIVEAVRNLSFGLQADMLSPDINDFIGARLSGLDKSVRSFADLVAVMQSDMSLRLLQLVSGMDRLEVVNSIETLLALGILREFVDARGDVCYCFTHQKLRDHIYNSISLSKRMLLHEKIANGLETLCTGNRDSYLPMRQLLYHYGLADNLYKVATLRLDRQERLAKRRYEMFRLDVVRPAWDVDFLDDSTDDSERELNEIHELLHNPRLHCDKDALNLLRFRYTYLLSRLRYSQGRDDEGRFAMESMLRYARALHREELLADAYLRVIFQSADDYELDKMESYIGLAKGLGCFSTDPVYAAMVRHYEAVLLQRQHQLAQSRALLEENIVQLNNLSVENNVDAQIAMNYYTLSTVEIMSHDLDDAEKAVQMARKFCRNSGSEPGPAMLSLNAGWLYYERKEYESALTSLQSAEAFFTQSGFLENRGLLYSALAQTCLALGKTDEAARYGAVCRALLDQLKIQFERDTVDRCLKTLAKAGLAQA